MKVCMISYSVYEFDNRVHRYGETLMAAGCELDVICLSATNKPRQVDYGTGTLYEIQSRQFNEKGPVSYLFKFMRFFFKSVFLLTCLYMKKRYDVIHYHNIPDPGVFIAAVPKLCGARIVLDIHDLVPEFYQWKFGVGQHNSIISMLKYAERVSCRFADHVIVGTHLWKERLVSRSVQPEKCSVIMNAPLPQLFDPVKGIEKRRDAFSIIYPGSLNEHFGVDVAVRGMDVIRKHIPGAVLNIYGQGRQEEMLRNIVTELGLENNVRFHGPVMRHEIPRLIAESHMGVVPKQASLFADEALSSKLLEFVYMGKPAVVSRTTIGQYYFDDTMVRFFTPGDSQDFARNVIDLYDNPEKQRNLSRNCARFNKEHSWQKYRARYLTILEYHD